MVSETLQRLTVSSGMGVRIPVRTVFTIGTEIKAQSAGNTFTKFLVYVVDSSGHYTVVRRSIFGTEEQRQKIMKEMQAFSAAGKVFTMSKVSGVERNNPQYICVSVPNVIKYDRVASEMPRFSSRRSLRAPAWRRSYQR